MATYSTNKQLINLCKNPRGRYIGAGFVNMKTKRLKVVMCWRERNMQILLIAIK